MTARHAKLLVRAATCLFLLALSRTTRAIAPIAACLFLLTWSRTAAAHGADPVGVTVRETAGGSVLVQVRSTNTTARTWPIDVVLPPGCARASSTSTSPQPLPSPISPSPQIGAEARYFCDAPLEGRSFQITGLEDAGAPVVVRVELAGGRTYLDVATLDHPTISIPLRSPWWTTLDAYGRLGIRHLATGLDHLLFIAGLLLVARRFGRTVRALTAFTLGHSVTLCASALGWLSFPTRLAELAIAASLLFLAVRVVRNSGAARALSFLSFALGLLHGLGFAAALAQTGLHDVDVPLALFGFNMGIELAQIALVTLLAVTWLLARKLGLPSRPRHRTWLGHALGATAAMWCIERFLALLPS